VHTLGMSGIIAAYILIALLLLSINLYSKWSWPVKAATIIVTSAFYAVTYYSLPSLLGWPTTETLPPKFKLDAIRVVQPDKLTGEKGAIYLWVSKLKNLQPDSVPRAYRLPYSKPLFAEVNKARVKMGKGVQQIGEYKKQDANMKRVKNAARSGQISLPLRFYDLPDTLYPDK